MDGMEFDILSYINRMSSGKSIRKVWEEMSQEEKEFLQVLLKGSEIDAKDFIDGDDFFKHDELVFADMNVYMFQPYFENFEKIHTMPEELKEMITYGVNPDEFMGMSDDEKRKYLRSLCLNIDDYESYFEDEELMYITQESLDQEQTQMDYLITEYDNAIDEYAKELEMVEGQVDFLENVNIKLFADNRKLENEIQSNQRDIDSAYNILASVVRELFEEKTRYLSLLSRSFRNKLSIQRIKGCFANQFFSKDDIEKAIEYFRKCGIQIVDGQEIKKRINYEKADYTKTRAYSEAVKASEVNAFSAMDDWQKRF